MMLMVGHMKINSFKNWNGLVGSTGHQSGPVKAPKPNKTENQDQNRFFDCTYF